MAANKRTKSQIEKDRVTIAHMLLEGKTVRAITAKVGTQYPGGLAISTVQRDIEAVRSEWRERAVNDYDNMLAEELARLANVECKAWEAFNRSTNSAEVRSARHVTDARTGQVVQTIETTKTTVDPPGNAAFLQVVLKCIETRSRLLGLHITPDLLAHAEEAPCVFTFAPSDDPPQIVTAPIAEPNN